MSDQQMVALAAVASFALYTAAWLVTGALLLRRRFSAGSDLAGIERRLRRWRLLEARAVIQRSAPAEIGRMVADARRLAADAAAWPAAERRHEEAIMAMFVGVARAELRRRGALP